MGRPENTMNTNDGICTPQSIWQPIVDALGAIDFDPCSHPASTVPAASQVFLPDYCTDESVPEGWHSTPEYDFTYADGLRLTWAGTGRLFFNGPYSQLPDAKNRPSWLGKFVDDRAPEDARVGFLPVRTACEWWQDHVMRVDVLTFLAERVKHDNVFWAKDSKDGKHKKGDPLEEGAAFSQCLIYVGPNPAEWAEHARKLGGTIELWRLR